MDEVLQSGVTESVPIVSPAISPGRNGLGAGSDLAAGQPPRLRTASSGKTETSLSVIQFGSSRIGELSQTGLVAYVSR